MTVITGERTDPLLRCPARLGNGADIRVADFTFVVEDCDTGPDGRPTVTEVFGYFRQPGDEDDDHGMETASIVVPVGSPIARIAHQVGADPKGRLTQKTAAMLRGNVIRCSCTTRAECPALSESSLLLAMEHALGLEPDSQLTAGGAE